MKTRIFLVLSLAVAACNTTPDKRKLVLNNHILSDCNTAIQNAIVIDHVSAPVGGRRYYYACVAAYEAVRPFYDKYRTLAGQLKDLTPGPAPDTTQGYCLDLVALAAHTFTSQKLVFKEDSIIAFRTRKLNWYKNQIDEAMFERSIAYGDSVGKHIFKWARKDSYDQTRGNFFEYDKEAGKWQPTSPDFADAIEPLWHKIRVAAIPSPDFSKIPPPEPFSRDKNSRFYAITKEVYDAVQRKDSAELLTAKYWDDNSNTMVHMGHVTISILKVSPAGHWMGMFGTISRQKNYSLIESAEGYARFGAVIHDAFIACWDAKYKTNYIRPETAIRMLIDSSWVSAIQTPAFPEYPSGHSVVSTAVGTLSQAYFGDFEFTDSAEYEFGLGTRKFKGILAASQEACMSRLYGGIHFIDAIRNGQMMGREIGEYHLKNITTKVP